MKVVDNTNSLNYIPQSDSTFLPVLTWAFTNSSKTIVFTEAGTVPVGDTFKAVNVEVFDKNGNKKTGSISAEDGTLSIDLDAATSLDLTGDINIKAVAITTAGLAKDGSFYGLKPNADATGALEYEK